MDPNSLWSKNYFTFIKWMILRKNLMHILVLLKGMDLLVSLTCILSRKHCVCFFWFNGHVLQKKKHFSRNAAFYVFTSELFVNGGRKHGV